MNTDIGDPEIAAFLFEWITVYRERHVPYFEILGNGWSRYAYLGPDGVVYKIARGVEDRNIGRPERRAYQRRLVCSESEAMFYKSSAEKISESGFRLAACRMLGDVLAMEYVKPFGYVNDWNDIETLERTLGVDDMHGGNVWKDENGVITLIDYAGNPHCEALERMFSDWVEV